MLIKQKLKVIWMYILYPYDWIKAEIEYRKKIKKLKEQDPYIYE